MLQNYLPNCPIIVIVIKGKPARHYPVKEWAAGWESLRPGSGFPVLNWKHLTWLHSLIQAQVTPFQTVCGSLSATNHPACCRGSHRNPIRLMLQRKNYHSTKNCHFFSSRVFLGASWGLWTMAVGPGEPLCPGSNSCPIGQETPRSLASEAMGNKLSTSIMILF